MAKASKETASETMVVLFAGTEVVEFSPTEELQATIEVVSRNMEAVG
jgi:hypothetical protein